MPELEHKLLEQTLDELDEARDWMLTLGRKTAGEKSCEFSPVDRHPCLPDNESDSVEFELPMSRVDIADFLGLTMETVSRQFGRKKFASPMASSRDHQQRMVGGPDIPACRIGPGTEST